MKFQYGKRFFKDLAIVPKPFRELVENLVFEKLPSKNVDVFFAMISKLKNQDSFYKIRVGDYRVGIFIDNDTVEFRRVLHRREIYRFFP
ncbi:MAG: type II toxin-antitoxin system RelE/ParE family toxin [Nitrospirae bacterium]|nr:type II toxin-antitoxin system RelE/ParE family toxin [Nitrospirota bacterium]MBF0591575.1 type II toxin-antitoxin system RelE/ParE family toxin [Nitrospirota bacterium]